MRFNGRWPVWRGGGGYIQKIMAPELKEEVLVGCSAIGTVDLMIVTALHNIDESFHRRHPPPRQTLEYPRGRVLNGSNHVNSKKRRKK